MVATDEGDPDWFQILQQGEWRIPVSLVYQAESYLPRCRATVLSAVGQKRERPRNHRVSDGRIADGMIILTLSMGTIEGAIIGLGRKRSKS
jgi:hypothetical protein